MAQRLIIAIDSGGTFTDCVFRLNGRVEVLKLPSTPDDPGRAILNAVETILERSGATEFDVRHGTTVATNALLERKGARVAFVTTAGFEDTLALGRQARPALYDWNEHRAASIADADCCFGVNERIGADGAVIVAPTIAGLNKLRKEIRRSKAESIAVSLLFAFVNAVHERAVAEALGTLRMPISLSHEILPEFREYERGSTVALNAYVAPRMATYIRGLESNFAARGGRLSIMQSSGGILSAQMAAREPVRTILSGPAGGVIGALSVARAAGIERVLSFDMGGTSTDVALLDVAREPATTSEGRIAGLPVGVPMLDIHTAGAGGGSLARIDAAGILQVGPQSAGAKPGPACYGRGEEATVTDANLVMGRLLADHFLGGAMRLDERRARRALEQVAQTGFACLEDLAEGIVRVANVRMESALRRVSVERGQDPREFTLLAFGGAGPLHACDLAQALGIGNVLIPSVPGALSALGILDADLRREFSRTVMVEPVSTQIERIFRELEAEARGAFAEEGATPGLLRAADLRYKGQGFELQVEWGMDVVSKFHRLHEKTYGYSDRERTVEVVTLRVKANARTRKPRAVRAVLKRGTGEQARIASHRIFEEGRWRRAAIYDRSLLEAGNRFDGPAVVMELSATTYVPSSWTLRVDEHRNLLLTPRERKEGRRG